MLSFQSVISYFWRWLLTFQLFKPTSVKFCLEPEILPIKYQTWTAAKMIPQNNHNLTLLSSHISSCECENFSRNVIFFIKHYSSILWLFFSSSAWTSTFSSTYFLLAHCKGNWKSSIDVMHTYATRRGKWIFYNGNDEFSSQFSIFTLEWWCHIPSNIMITKYWAMKKFLIYGWCCTAWDFSTWWHSHADITLNYSIRVKEGVRNDDDDKICEDLVNSFHSAVPLRHARNFQLMRF